jgi:GNAT superfamily N-acetyltransferase
MKSGCPSDVGAGRGPEKATVKLRGVPYVIRPLRPDDEQRLQDFFYSHSKETIQLRYGYMISTMTHERAYELVNVDQQKDVALGIFEAASIDPAVDAVGRYYSDAGGKEAEIAFVVRESKRRRGMAGVLISHMAEYAHGHGIVTFVANVLRDNEEMRSLFSHYSPEVSSVIGSAWLTYRLPVELILAPARGHPGRHP